MHYCFRFPKTTFAILKFYFRFLFWHRHQHFILPRPTKFHINQTTLYGGVMTSYRFFKMAAAAILDFVWDRIKPPTDGPTNWYSNFDLIGYTISEILLQLLGFGLWVWNCLFTWLFLRACAESTANLLSGWKLSQHSNSLSRFAYLIHNFRCLLYTSPSPRD